MFQIIHLSAKQEVSKALFAIHSDATKTTLCLEDAKEIIRSRFKPGINVFAAFYPEPRLNLPGLKCIDFLDGTLGSTYCSKEIAIKHYGSLLEFRDAPPGVVIYSSPDRLEILSERF